MKKQTWIELFISTCNSDSTLYMCVCIQNRTTKRRDDQIFFVFFWLPHTLQLKHVPSILLSKKKCTYFILIAKYHYVLCHCYFLPLIFLRILYGHLCFHFVVVVAFIFISEFYLRALAHIQNNLKVLSMKCGSGVK